MPGDGLNDELVMYSRQCMAPAHRSGKVGQVAGNAPGTRSHFRKPYHAMTRLRSLYCRTISRTITTLIATLLPDHVIIAIYLSHPRNYREAMGVNC